jgi:osmoprotectant transport system permease protein
MEAFLDAYDIFLREQPRFWRALSTHLTLSLTSLAIAVAVCVPLGIWIARRAGAASVVINVFSALRVIPSLVILFLALPYLGLGFWPSLVALTVLACPPVLLNTYAGLRGVDPATVEAARGMGMSPGQSLLRVELPLALPAIIAGIRTAAVEVIASATLAAFIAGGGLGDYLQRGFQLNEPSFMIVGAVAVALLAICAEVLLAGVQRALTPPARAA